MSGLAWIILNAALLIAAIGGTVAIKKRPAPAPLVLENTSQQPQSQKSPRGTSSGAAGNGSRTREGTGEYATRSNMDELWSQTLFLPTREEAPDAVAGSNATAAAAVNNANENAEFELVGVAQLRQQNTEPVPVAILRPKNSGGRNGNANGRRFGGGRNTIQNNSGMGQNGAPGAPERQFAAQAPKEVFKVGDKINDTGYVIKAIDISKHEVEIARGSLSVKLTINFSNPDANKRRETAVQQEQKQRQQTLQAEAERIRNLQASRQQANNKAPAPPNTNQQTANARTQRNQSQKNTSANAGTGGSTATDSNAAARQRIIQQLRQRRASQNNQNNTQK